MPIASVTPLPTTDPHLVPEAMFISSLIDTGQYQPDTYQVRDDYFAAHRAVHEYCQRHQEEAKCAPDITLIRRKFKNFPYMPKVNPLHASRVLKESWERRIYLSAMSKATLELNGDDFDVKAAHGHLKTAVETANPTVSTYAKATDYALFDKPKDIQKIPVDLNPADRLTVSTGGGVAPGHLWLVASRLGIGKTWRLAQMAVSAAEAGWNAWFYSTEMPADEVIDRIHRVALRDTWTKPWAHITPDQRAELFDQWQATSGAINVVDTEMVGPMSAVTVAGNTGRDSIALVDYVGNFYTEAGQPAADYVTITQVSKELKQAAMRHKIPVIAAAQINREGGKSDAPGAHHLANGDIGRDADVIVTMTESSTRLRLNSLTKNRHGRQGFKWFTFFDPDAGQFYDLDPSKVGAIREADEDFASAAIS